MRLMGLMQIYQKPKASKAAKEYKISPSLLRGLRVDRLNWVWRADITYLPLLGRFASQIVCRAMDATRAPVSGGDHGLVHPQSAGEAHLKQTGGRILRRSLERSDRQVGLPQIVNIDQGSQFTSFALTDLLRRSNVRISMDG